MKKAITMRMEEEMIEECKAIAAKCNIGYQTYIKLCVAEDIERRKKT